MLRRIIINVLLAFLLIPAILFGKRYVEQEILNNSNYPVDINEHLSYFIGGYLLVVPLCFLTLVLLPYNLIITRGGNAGKRTLGQKFFTFFGLMVLMFAFASLFQYFLLNPLWKNVYYIVAFASISIVCTTVIHFSTDIKETTQ